MFTPIRFPGQYHDQETDLFENWNRYYDPSIGRYLQPEPMLEALWFIKDSAFSGHSMPTYAYALNNPMAFTDPDGNQAPGCTNTHECECRKNPTGTACTGNLDPPVEPPKQPRPVPPLLPPGTGKQCEEDKETKDECAEHFTKCHDQGGGKLPGATHGQTLCGQCMKYCNDYGFWPLAVYSRIGPNKRRPCPGQ
jgi:RHS repeat-associated protein